MGPYDVYPHVEIAKWNTKETYRFIPEIRYPRRRTVPNKHKGKNDRLVGTYNLRILRRNGE